MQSIQLALVMLLAVCQFANAQVKKQFQDDTNKQTTVVVKEDALNDYDVLNHQFNIDDVGMGTVIRIDTERELPAPAPEEMTTDISENVTIQTQIPTIKTVQERTIKSSNRAAQPVSTNKVTKSSAGKSSAVKRSPRGSGKRININKKFKVKKKKRRNTSKRKRFKSCYRF